MPLDLMGHISAYTHSNADIVIDIIGYIPKSDLPTAPVDVDLSDKGLVRYYGGEQVVMTNRKYLQINAEDPDGNGIKDWELTGDNAVLSYLGIPPTREQSVTDGPTVDGVPTKHVEYTGTVREWVEHAQAGKPDESNPDLVTALDIPMRNAVTGENGTIWYPVTGHYEGTPVTSTGTDPSLENSAAVKAPAATYINSYIAMPEGPIGVEGHEPTINFTLPDAFVDLAKDGITVTSDNLRMGLGSTEFPQGIITRDTDGDNQLSFTLPEVKYYHDIELTGHEPDSASVTLHVEALDGDAAPAEFYVDLIRK